MQPTPGVLLNPPRTAEPVDTVPERRALYAFCTKSFSTPPSMSTLRRVARPSPSVSVAVKASGSVGSSTRVMSGEATSSPMRSANSERPFSTASPSSV